MTTLAWISWILLGWIALGLVAAVVVFAAVSAAVYIGCDIVDHARERRRRRVDP